MLKINVDFCTLLIGVEGTKTPAGVRGRGDPAGAKSAEEAPRHARGKRSAWNGNQQTILTQPSVKPSIIVTIVIMEDAFR
ncbi:hypothetical protein ACE198_22175 [Neobacillus sp. KR4-4]|uniref:hypothetical protein n=1 Tax=Neobacillus sp. KR4-4 TaxID=3344872 RepID=UPI0035CA229B